MRKITILGTGHIGLANIVHETQSLKKTGVEVIIIENEKNEQPQEQQIEQQQGMEQPMEGQEQMQQEQPPAIKLEAIPSPGKLIKTS